MFSDDTLQAYTKGQQKWNEGNEDLRLMWSAAGSDPGGAPAPTPRPLSPAPATTAPHTEDDSDSMSDAAQQVLNSLLLANAASEEHPEDDFEGYCSAFLRTVEQPARDASRADLDAWKTSAFKNVMVAYKRSAQQKQASQASASKQHASAVDVPLPAGPDSQAVPLAPAPKARAAPARASLAASAGHAEAALNPGQISPGLAAPARATFATTVSSTRGNRDGSARVGKSATPAPRASYQAMLPLAPGENTRGRGIVQAGTSMRSALAGAILSRLPVHVCLICAVGKAPQGTHEPSTQVGTRYVMNSYIFIETISSSAEALCATAVVSARSLKHPKLPLCSKATMVLASTRSKSVMLKGRTANLVTKDWLLI